MDLTLLLWIQSHLRTEVLDTFFKFFTHLGDLGIFWILLTIILIARPKTRYTGIVMATSLLVSVIFTEALIKPLIDRPRPFELYPMDLLIPAPVSSSFPSGHSSSSFAAATAFFLNEKKGPWRWILMIMAVMIAFSRLYLFVHNPTDVLAGTLLGLLIGYGTSRCLKQTNNLYRQWGEHV